MSKTKRVNYQADDAIAQWNKEKTKSSASWAFKDADYATALWRCETEMDKLKDGIIWIFIWFALLGGLYGLSYLDKVLK